MVYSSSVSVLPEIVWANVKLTMFQFKLIARAQKSQTLFKRTIESQEHRHSPKPIGKVSNNSLCGLYEASPSLYGCTYNSVLRETRHSLAYERRHFPKLPALVMMKHCLADVWKCLHMNKNKARRLSQVDII